MSWSELLTSNENSVPSGTSPVGQGDSDSTIDFNDIADSSFHGERSLLMDDSASKSMDFSDIVESCFREI